MRVGGGREEYRKRERDTEIGREMRGRGRR